MELSKIIDNALNSQSDEFNSRYGLLLFSLVIILNCKNVLEIGVRTGGSTIPILKALEYTKGKLISIDIVDNIELRNTLGQIDYWDFKIQNSIYFLKSLSNSIHFDFIFLDGWHTKEHILEELTLLDNHVSPTSIILVHDTMAPGMEPDYHIFNTTNGEWAGGGPYAAIQTLDKNKWEFSTIPRFHGLTILRKIGKIR